MKRLIAVYRIRLDGDGEIIAVFDIENCEGFFADNQGNGAERLIKIIQESLQDEDNDKCFIAEFNDWSEVVDVLSIP